MIYNEGDITYPTSRILNPFKEINSFWFARDARIRRIYWMRVGFIAISGFFFLYEI